MCPCRTICRTETPLCTFCFVLLCAWYVIYREWIVSGYLIIKDIVTIIRLWCRYCKDIALKPLSVLFCIVVSCPFCLQRIVRDIHSFKMVTSVKAVGKYCPPFTLTDLVLRLDTLRSQFYTTHLLLLFHFLWTLLFLRFYGLSECIRSCALQSNERTSSFILHIIEC